MKIKQVSVFLENKPGHLSRVCRRLADANINLVTQSLADTDQFGILRLIVKEWEKAKELMEQDGRVVKIVDVLAAEVEDRPGGLADVLTVLEKAGINVEYMYAFVRKLHNSAVLIFRFNNPDEAMKVLQDNGIRLISEDELYQS